MWLNGGYYYRGVIFCTPEELAALTEHLNGPPAPAGPDKTRFAPTDETRWSDVFDFIESKHPYGTNSYSGEDWPQPIGTWDAIYYPHTASNPDTRLARIDDYPHNLDTGHVTIPEASDARREHDVCPCLLTEDGSQSPDCNLPNYEKPIK